MDVGGKCVSLSRVHGFIFSGIGFNSLKTKNNTSLFRMDPYISTASTFRQHRNVQQSHPLQFVHGAKFYLDTTFMSHVIVFPN